MAAIGALGEAREHDGRRAVRGTAREALPELLGNERHEGVEEAKTIVEDRVERVLRRAACGGIRCGGVGNELDRLLRSDEAVASVSKGARPVESIARTM